MFFRNNIGWIGDPVWLVQGPGAALFFDTLVIADPQGNIKPNLVTAEVAPDQKSVTLKLTKGVKFQDGSDWNATAAKWNLDVLADADTDDYRFVDSVDIVDDHTVKLNMNDYTNGFLTTMGATCIVSKAAYDAHGGGDAGAEYLRWNPVGTGPFKMVSFKPNVSVKTVRFDDYWKGKPYLDGIEMYFIPDAMVKAQALQAGEVDMMGADGTKIEYDLLQQDKTLKVLQGPIAIMVLVPDSADPTSPLSKQEVREAIDYAIDRDAIVKNLGWGYWKTTYQFAVPGTPPYITDLQGREYNVDKAKQLLADADVDKLTIQAVGSIITTNRDALEAIQGMLAKVGITLEINLIDHGAFNTSINQGWEGFSSSGRLIDANMEYAMDTDFLSPNNCVSLEKPDELLALHAAALQSTQFDPALTQKVIRYISDHDTFISLFTMERAIITKSYVMDTGFYNYSRVLDWDPDKTWLNK
jgi:peptide/nickel transport system substrate-binding protein